MRPRHLMPRIALITLCALAAFAPPLAHSQPERALRSTKPASNKANHKSALRAAIQSLIEEAQRAIDDQKLPTTTADFAQRFKAAGNDVDEISALELVDAITQPQHKDEFIDAYVRWQLTSFEPGLPALDDRQFASVLANAPCLVDNPRAEPQAVELFEQAEKQPQLSDRDLAKLRELAAELDRRAPIAESFNQPAEAWREWIIARLEQSQDPDLAARNLQMMLERCAATVTAGWPPRTVKASITKALKSAASDPAITAHHRQLIAEQARSMIGSKRLAINEITFTATGGVRASFSTASITKSDAEKWIELLLGR